VGKLGSPNLFNIFLVTLWEAVLHFLMLLMSCPQKVWADHFLLFSLGWWGNFSFCWVISILLLLQIRLT